MGKHGWIGAIFSVWPRNMRSVGNNGIQEVKLRTDFNNTATCERKRQEKRLVVCVYLCPLFGYWQLASNELV